MAPRTKWTPAIRAELRRKLELRRQLAPKRIAAELGITVRQLYRIVEDVPVTALERRK